MEDTSKIRIVRYNSLSLYNNENKARLEWSVRGIYPRIVIYTSDKAFENNKPNYDHIIIAPFDIMTLNYLVSNLELCSNTKDPSKFRIDCYNTKVVNGVRTNDRYLQASVEIGKDEEGINYIKVSEEKKPTVKFKLLPNTIWFKYYDKDGNRITDNNILSKIFTRGYINSIKNLILNNKNNYQITELEIDQVNKPINKIVNEEKTTNTETKEDKTTSEEKDVKVKNDMDLDSELEDIKW